MGIFYGDRAPKSFCRFFFDPNMSFNINMQLASAAASQPLGHLDEADEFIFEFSEAPPSFISPTASPQLLPVTPVRDMTHAALIIGTMFNRITTSQMSSGQITERTTYTIKPEFFRSQPGPLAAQASTLRSRSSFSDAIHLLAAAYLLEHELGHRSIRSCRVTVLDAEGRAMPKQLYIPARMIEEGTGQQAFLQLAQESMGVLAEACIDAQMDTPYSAEAFFGTEPDRFAVDGFSFISRYTYHQFNQRSTVVMGLPEALKDKLRGTTSIAGIPVRNLDMRLEGHCLFETVGALTGRSPAMLRQACGNPQPGTVDPASYLQPLVEAAGCRLRLFRASARTNSPVMVYRADPTAEGCPLFSLLLVRTALTNNIEYTHVFRMGAQAYEPCPAAEDRTTFISFDTETIYDEACVNRAWAMNLLAYRAVPTPPSLEYVNTRRLEVQAQAIDAGSGEEYPLFLEDGARINPAAAACAVIYFQEGVAGLDSVITNLWSFIGALHRHCAHPAGWRYILIGFNSACFDNFILARALSTSGRCIDTMDVGIFGSRILELNFSLGDGISVSCWDIRRHVVGSLDSCCQAWGVPSGGLKGHLEHSVVQALYDLAPENFAAALAANRHTQVFTAPGGEQSTLLGIESYCRQDAVSTAALHVLVRYAIPSIPDCGAFMDHGASFTWRTYLAMGGADPEEVARKLALHAPLPVRPLFQLNIPAGSDEEYCALVCSRVPPELFKGGALVSLKQAADRLGLSGLRGFRLRSMAIESYSTLAQFAAKIGKTIEQLEGLTNIGGFDYESAAILREHVCLAGRSQAKLGVYEDEPLVMADVVSLYPTAMTAPSSSYALKGTASYHEGADYETHRSTPGIWKVSMGRQASGVVIPAKSPRGYWWNTDEAVGTTRLLSNPDINSLRLTGAELQVLDGITFDQHSTQLYGTYVKYGRIEKTHQDALLAGSAQPRFAGELYSPGRREASKLILNIRSGKEITKMRKGGTRLGESAAYEYSADRANQQQQLLLAKRARETYDDPLLQRHEKLASSRALMTQAAQIERLTGDPCGLSDRLVSSHWSKQPKGATTSQFNGNLIYGYSRQYMTGYYAALGYESILVTETDSVLFTRSQLPKLYAKLSPWGLPALYAEDERKLGLLDAPACDGVKQFGQLELESTELIKKKLAAIYRLYKLNPDGTAKLGADGKPALDPKLITSLHWAPEDPADPKASHELIMNGQRTGLRGPYAIIAGKKVYALYLLNSTGRVYLKSRFKGLSMGRDVVQECTGDCAAIQRTAQPRDDIRFINLTVPYERPAGFHLARTEDIEALLKVGHLHIMQNQIARANIAELTTINTAVSKRIELAPQQPLEDDRAWIAAASEKVKLISMRAMVHRLNGTKGLFCETCGEVATATAGRALACALHATKAAMPICKHQTPAGEFDCGFICGPSEKFCPLHLAKRIDSDGELLLCSTANCDQPARPQPILAGQLLCERHLQAVVGAGLPTCSVQKDRARGGTLHCQAVVYRGAVEKGYELCRSHFYHLTTLRKEQPKMTAAARQELLDKLDVLERAAPPAADCPEILRQHTCMHPVSSGRRGMGLCGREVPEGEDRCPAHQHATRSKPMSAAAELSDPAPPVPAPRPAAVPCEHLLAAARQLGLTGCQAMVEHSNGTASRCTRAAVGLGPSPTFCEFHQSRTACCQYKIKSQLAPGTLEDCARPCLPAADGMALCVQHATATKRAEQLVAPTEKKKSGPACTYKITRGVHRGELCGCRAAHGTADQPRCVKHK